MTSQEGNTAGVWRSIGALLARLLAVVLLSLGADQVLHVLKVYAPCGQAMPEPGSSCWLCPMGSCTPSLVAT